MPYNSVTGRTAPGASPLIPEDVQREIVQSVEVKSAAMQLMPHVQMKRAQQRIPVNTQLPIAYWLTGASLDARDRGMKQTTSIAWDNVYLNAEEMAVIVPIAKTLLDDLDYDFWAQVKPKVTEAFAVALDDAIFFGTNAPASFPTAIVTAANSAGNLLVEPIYFSNAGLSSFGTSASGYSMIGGQWDQSMLAIREDVSMEMFDTGVITDNGAPPVIQFNLMQQDMVALRVIARFAWAVPNPVNRQQPTAAARYPFAVIQQKASTGGE